LRRQPTRPRAITPRSRTRSSFGACALLALLGEISSARAATFVWDGGHNAQSRWTDKANWIGDQDPVTDGSADLVFTGTLRLSNDSNGAWSVNSVTFNNLAGAFTLSGGALTLQGAAVPFALANDDIETQTIQNALITGSAQVWSASNGNLVLSGTVLNNHALTLTGAYNTTVSGAVSGSGSLIKTGSGTLALSGANSYSGGTTLSAGTLQGTSLSLQGDIATASGASLVFDQSFDGAYSGLVSGSGSLTKSGSGVLTLSGANSHSGGTTISAGGLALGASDALSASGALTLGAGTTLSLGGAYSARVASLSHAGATLDFGAAGSANAFLFDSAGTGSGTLTVLNWTSGADILAFASGVSVADAFIENIYFSGIGSGVRGATGVSVSGYSGAWDTIVASAATFSTWDGGGANDHFGTDANWAGDAPPASGPTTKVAFSGSTRISPNLAADFTLNSLKFDSGAAASFTLSTNSGKTLTFAGSVPSLIQASASAQTVAVPVALTKNTFVEMSGAGDLVLSGTVSGAGGFTVLGSGAGEVVLSGANTYSGSTAINAGTVVLQHGSALGSTAAGTSVAAGATLRLENTISVGAESLALSGTLRQSSGSNTYAGPISGSGSLVVDGGQLTLSGSSANTYSGDTLVHAGTLVLGKSAGVSAVSGDLTIGSGSGSAQLTLSAPHQIADSSRVTLSSSGSPVFNLAGHNETLGSLASSNSASSVSLGSATLSTGADHSSTSFAGVLSGSGSLVKLGSGSFTLSGSNTYSGSTAINAGTVVLQNSSALGSTAAGTSVASGATLRLENTISVGAESLALSGTLRQSSGSNTYAGPISGSGSLVVDGGQLTLSGSSANTYSGDTLVHAGTLVLGKSSGVSAVSGDLTIGSGSGSAQLTLSAPHQIADSSRVTLSSSGSPVFNLAGHNETLGSLASSNSASSVSLGSATLSTGADHSSTSFAGVLSGSGSLVKLGSGSFTLSGSNTYSGSTTVSSGTLVLAASDRLADGSALALAGGTLSLGGVASERVGVFSYTDGSVLDFGAAGAANSLLFASGGGSTGTLVVRNFTEGVDILGSSVDTLDQSFLDNIFFDGLGVGLGAEYVAGGPVSVSGYTGVFHRLQPIETFTWTGLNNSGGGARDEWIDGANWNKGAPGVNRAIVMTGANYLSHTLGADFSIQSLLFDRQAGAFDIGGANNLTIRGGGIYNDSLYDQTLSTRVTLSANQTWTAATADLAVTGPNLYLNAHTLSVAGAADTLVSALVSDSGGITKNGSGTLTLSHSGNSYSGATLINAGTLLVTADGALGSAAAGTTVRSGGTLALSGGIDYATTESLTLAGSGASAGGALRNVSGDNRYAGSVALSADASLASAAGTLTLSGGLDLATHRATFAGAGDITVSGAVSGAGSLLKTGSGTLALAAANTYAGLTTITGGTLLASHASALGATTGGTVVDDGATLALSGGVSIGAESLTLSGSGAGGIGALRNQSGANAFAGAITLAADTTLLSASGSLSLTGTLAAGGHSLSVDGAGDLTIASTLSGATDLRKSGSGVLAFTADQTFSGEITLSGGTLSLVDSEISVATLRVTAGSVLDFAGSSTLRVGELLLELGTGETLSITRWQDLSDYLLVTHFDGAAYDRPGVPPAHQIVFAAFSGADTRWQSHNNEVTPVPEPSAYGALALGGLAAWSALRRRRPSPNPHRPGAC